MKKSFEKRARGALIYSVAALAAAGMILMPVQSSAGGYNGLRLCARVLIPSLFPFFVVSNFFIELGGAQRFGAVLEPVCRRFLHAPAACSAALVLGYVGGYPVGASVVSSLYGRGMCEKEDAERLLAMCNNSGPAFIFGVVGGGLLGSPRAGGIIFICHILASLSVCLLLRGGSPASETGHATPPYRKPGSLAKAFVKSVKTAFESVLNICAFVIFFCVLLSMLEHIGAIGILAYLPETALRSAGLDASCVRPVIRGIFELSSGISALRGCGSAATLMICSSFLLGWAGISVHFQVISLVCEDGLSVKKYLIGKLLHGVFAAAYAAVAARFVALPAFSPSAQDMTSHISMFYILSFAAAALILVIAVKTARGIKSRRGS